MLNRSLPVALLCAFILSAVGCGGGTGILNMQTPYTTATKDASLDNVARTIITASAYKGWKPEIAGPGHITATRRHAGRAAKVDISYTSNSFNIQYLDSDNMQYTGTSISPVYEQWVEELQDEIKRRLSAL